jgi:hypothetical protein
LASNVARPCFSDSILPGDAEQQGGPLVSGHRRHSPLPALGQADRLPHPVGAHRLELSEQLTGSRIEHADDGQGKRS